MQEEGTAGAAGAEAEAGIEIGIEGGAGVIAGTGAGSGTITGHRVAGQQEVEVEVRLLLPLQAR
jgi:hypothetical protein